MASSPQTLSDSDWARVKDLLDDFYSRGTWTYEESKLLHAAKAEDPNRYREIAFHSATKASTRGK